MHNFLYKFVLLAFALSISSYIFSENKDTTKQYFDENFLRFDNYSYNSKIITVRMYPEFDVSSEPIMKLNSGEHLLLDFDDLKGEVKDYYYKLIHCTSNWESSELSYSDYIDGFEINQIRDYDFSFNTYFNYVHYTLTIPNNDIKIKISGNYLLQVFEDYDEDNLVLTRRFYVVEPNVSVDAEVKRATLVEKMNSHQEIDFTIKTGMFINDPFKELKVIVQQNNRWDSRNESLKPLYIKDGEFIYDYQEENLFPGTNEFRFFNTKDIRFESQGIERIDFIKPYYHFTLTKSEVRRFKVYFYDEDLNGKYAIDIANGRDVDIEADYVYVHFTLPYPAPIVDGNLYIYGMLSDWGFHSYNKMQYNFETKSYDCTMLLKQGYYNYLYAFYKDGVKKADIGYIEANHYETENDYSIFVYLKENSSRYEKLIGFKKVNSLKRY